MKWRAEINVTEYYTFVTYVEADTQEEALEIAEKMNEDNSIASVFRDDVLFSSDTDYTITEEGH
jgi:hypothetical protein